MLVGLVVVLELDTDDDNMLSGDTFTATLTPVL
jgi:hypothetical protein